MAFHLFEVKWYFISLKRKGLHGECASIDCWGEGEPQKKLRIYFMSTDNPLPANGSQITANLIDGVIYQPAERYAWYLDLLRNEGPLQARVDGDDPNRNCLMTYDMESVGEGDGFALLPFPVLRSSDSIVSGVRVEFVRGRGSDCPGSSSGTPDTMLSGVVDKRSSSGNVMRRNLGVFS